MPETTKSLQRNFYEYDPSVAAAVVFAILYTATCGFTLWQYFSKRAWFWLFVIIASIMESIGYISRIVSVTNTGSMTPYIIQFLLIFLAPAILAASCYMAMGRVVLHVTPMKYRTMKILWVTPRAMTPLFVTCDVLSFLIQTFGGILSTQDKLSTKQRGFDIMKIGLAVQLICFGLFLIISFRFHLVAKRFREAWPDMEWEKFLWAVNIASVIIFIRSVYRMIEFATGFDGYLNTHEWNFYVFESAIILPVFVTFNFYHPAKYIKNVSWRQNRGDVELNQVWPNDSGHVPLK